MLANKFKQAQMLSASFRPSKLHALGRRRIWKNNQMAVLSAVAFSMRRFVPLYKYVQAEDMSLAARECCVIMRLFHQQNVCSTNAASRFHKNISARLMHVHWCLIA